MNELEEKLGLRVIWKYKSCASYCSDNL